MKHHCPFAVTASAYLYTSLRLVWCRPLATAPRDFFQDYWSGRRPYSPGVGLLLIWGLILLGIILPPRGTRSMSFFSADLRGRRPLDKQMLGPVKSQGVLPQDSRSPRFFHHKGRRPAPQARVGGDTGIGVGNRRIPAPPSDVRPTPACPPGRSPPWASWLQWLEHPFFNGGPGGRLTPGCPGFFNSAVLTEP